MGRPAKGALRWNTAKAVWEVRVTLKDGTRSKPVAMTGLAACLVAPTNPSAGCVCASCTSAFENGQKVSGRMRDGAAVETVTEETVNEWFDRYYAWRKGRPRGAESVADSKGRFKKWISPRRFTPRRFTPPKGAQLVPDGRKWRGSALSTQSRNVGSRPK